MSKRVFTFYIVSKVPLSVLFEVTCDLCTLLVPRIARRGSDRASRSGVRVQGQLAPSSNAAAEKKAARQACKYPIRLKVPHRYSTHCQFVVRISQHMEPSTFSTFSSCAGWRRTGDQPSGSTEPGRMRPCTLRTHSRGGTPVRDLEVPHVNLDGLD